MVSAMKMDKFDGYIDMLLLIHARPGCTANDIEDQLEMGIRKVYRSLEDLEEQGYIQREMKSGELGGYVYEVYLSEKGINYLKHLNQKLNEHLPPLK
jgi:predicted transcriptional regulator